MSMASGKRVRSATSPPVAPTPKLVQPIALRPFVLLVRIRPSGTKKYMGGICEAQLVSWRQHADLAEHMQRRKKAQAVPPADGPAKRKAGTMG